MSALYEIYKKLGMHISFNNEEYGLHYLQENKHTKKSKRHDFSLMTYLTKRVVMFTTSVKETGVAKVVSINNATLFTKNEAEMLRSKGLLIVPGKLIQQ